MASPLVRIAVRASAASIIILAHVVCAVAATFFSLMLPATSFTRSDCRGLP